MPLAFVCRTCGADLTGFLVEANPAALKFAINEAVVHAGEYFRVPAAMTKQEFYRMTFLDPEGKVVVVQAGDFLVNIADLRHQMDPQAHFGCCGYQGDFEANALCLNGHPVATVHSDCWHPAFVRLIQDLTEPVTA